jgi:hypothetical protein
LPPPNSAAGAGSPYPRSNQCLALARVRRPASGLMSIPKTHPAPPSCSFARLGRVLKVIDVRIAVRGSCRYSRRAHIIKQRLHFFAAPEERNGLASDRNQNPCARISSSSAFPDPYKKYPKPPQFITPGALPLPVSDITQKQATADRVRIAGAGVSCPACYRAARRACQSGGSIPA